MDRRAFLNTAGSSAAAAGLAGAGDRIRAALIGSGNRGRYLAANFKELGVEMAGVCDVYEPNLAAGLLAASEGAKSFSDYRRVLEDKSFDAVVIATPDHWHARMAIDAVEAGKDVYLEKPMAHTLDEGFRVRDAARRTRRVVQIGTQRRSSPLFIEAARLASSGALGDVRLVTSWWLNSTPNALPERRLAGKLDWRQWLGPAPDCPLDSARFFHWFWYWDYSGGMLVGQAAHIVDAIHMLTGVDEPRAVTCAGKLAMQGAEVPETTSMTAEYAGHLAVISVGYKAMRYPTFNDQLNQFHGSRARLDIGRESFALYPEDSRTVDAGPSVQQRRPGTFEASTRSHIRNFMDCIRSRHDPNATVEMGLSATVVLSMAVESLRRGRRLHFNPSTRAFES